MPHGDAGVVERGYADDAWAVLGPGGWPPAKTAASRRHRVGGGPGDAGGANLQGPVSGHPI